MNYLKKNLPSIIVLVFLLILPVFSIIADYVPEVTIDNPLGNTKTINELIKKILEGVVKIGMPIIVLAIIYSGFLFVAARGNSEKLNEAKRSLMYTLIGAAILLGSWGIAQLIKDTVEALKT